MPAVLTHKSILLLARERLAEIAAAIEARIAAGARVTDLERKLARVARDAYAMLSTPPYPETDLPGQLFARPVGDRLSKFAVMGSMGPDITGFSAILKPGQSWVFDTVHKSYPDSSREAVNAQTCDVAFALWRRVSTAINASSLPDDKKRKYLDNMRAYVLGHLCHLAGDIVSHPFINDLEWHLGHSGRDKLEHGDGEVSHDARAARLVLLRGSTREGQAWDGWWPTMEEVPPQFFDAYAEALEDIYRARSRRRTGFGAFEEHLADLEPPPLTADFIRDGYGLYRGGILSIGYGFGFWSWFGVLTLPILSAMLLPVLAGGLPRARVDLGDEPPADEPDPGERVGFEVATIPLALGALNATVFGIVVATLTTKHVETRTALGLIYAIVSTILGIVFFATVGAKNLHPGFRWPVLFGVPAAGALIAAILGFADFGRGSRGARGGLSMIYALPLFFLVLGLVCWLIFRIPVAAADDNDAGIDTAAFWITAGIWFALMLAAWIGFAFFLRDVKIPEKPDEFTAVKKHHVRLFDDATLFTDPQVAAARLPDLFFPAGRRPLLKLWWEGPGDLFIRSDRFRLVFSFADQENATSQFVPAPVGPMTLTEYQHFLENSVKDPDGNPGKLKTAFAYPGDSDYELPPGAAFADHGDEEEEAKDHAEKAAKFRKLGAAQDGAYLLHHAPKQAQAIRFGRRGPIATPFHLNEGEIRRSEDETGYDYVHDALAATESDTLMSYAGDLAALLCLGGATHMSAAAPPPDRIYQVFRNWNLDRRRVNEWRMLVAGSAFSEKAGHPENYDSRMLDGFGPADKAAWKAPLFAAGADVTAAAERTALRMGWVPLLRAWMDVARRPGQDMLADTSVRPENPTNHELTRAMAWLLDMTDPVLAP